VGHLVVTVNPGLGRTHEAHAGHGGRPHGREQQPRPQLRQLRCEPIGMDGLQQQRVGGGVVEVEAEWALLLKRGAHLPPTKTHFYIGESQSVLIMHGAGGDNGIEKYVNVGEFQSGQSVPVSTQVQRLNTQTSCCCGRQRQGSERCAERLFPPVSGCRGHDIHVCVCGFTG
jgi:hypothetical protein